MSDAIKHECGVAFIRLRKPLSYYKEKYGSYWYGLHKMQFVMTKQLNRGQDGAGMGVVKLDPEFGDRYLARRRSASKTALSDIFENIFCIQLQYCKKNQEEKGGVSNRIRFIGNGIVLSCN